MQIIGKRWQCYCWKCRGGLSFFYYRTLYLCLFINHQSSNYSRSLINIFFICTLDYWHLHPHLFPRSGSPPSYPDEMRDRRINPFSARNAQQQSWSLDGVNEIEPPGGRQPNPIRHRHRTSTVDRRSDSPLPSLQIGRRRPLITSDGNRQTWHNPSGRRCNQQRHNASRIATLQSNSGNLPAQHEAVSPVRGQPISSALGTREEIQSDDYVSPVAAMFGRAWHRYRGAEEQRAALRVGIENVAGSATDTTLDLLGTNPPQYEVPAQQLEAAMNDRRRTSERELRERFQRILSFREALADPSFHAEDNPIDFQTSRPPPLESEEMTANIACRVCHEQKIDTLLEPCMHLAICHWCSEVLQERTRRYRSNSSNPLYTSLHPQDDRLRCPICRRNVAQARKVFLAL